MDIESWDITGDRPTRKNLQSGQWNIGRGQENNKNNFYNNSHCQMCIYSSIFLESSLSLFQLLHSLKTNSKLISWYKILFNIFWKMNQSWDLSHLYIAILSCYILLPWLSCVSLIVYNEGSESRDPLLYLY